MKTIAFFNNKGGVGKTILVYHVAWMAKELGRSVLAVDLDPQANLTTMFLDQSELEKIWSENIDDRSIFSGIAPIIDGVGDISNPKLSCIEDTLKLIPGHLNLSLFEDKLSDSWPRCLERDKSAFRVITAFYRIMHQAAETMAADIVFIDVGPNFGAINRASLIAADYIVVPLSPSLFSLQGLKNLGPTLKTWREAWKKRLQDVPADLAIPMPSGAMTPLGYIVMQHVERKKRPVKAYQKWIRQIPEIYSKNILYNSQRRKHTEDTDPNRLSLIKNYLSLMPLAEDARKPMFKLTPADGAIGAHANAVSSCYDEFKALTQEIFNRIAQLS